MSHGNSDIQHQPVPPAPSCWNEIGVMGNHTCPELKTAIHCHNCGVFTAAAKAFLHRPAPPGYLAEWTRRIDDDDDAAACAADAYASLALKEGITLVIFRLGAEWLALPAAVVVEVTPVRPVHRIPHRSNQVLAGLVNLRGQLHICASLHGLLGTEPRPAVAAHGQGHGPERAARMIVIRREAESWVFTADEVVGVPRVPLDLLQNVPATLANPAVSFSKAVFPWQGQSIGLLDESRLFEALGSVGQ
jgi:chemotaxis-related protein WspD